MVIFLYPLLPLYMSSSCPITLLWTQWAKGAILLRMKVCGHEFTDTMIQTIQEKVNQEPIISRRALSRLVCEWLNWKSPNGKWKEMSARVALLRLEKWGKLTLPAPRHRSIPQRKSGPDPFLEPLPGITGSIADLGETKLVLVTSQDKSASHLWNTLFDRYHPLGSGPLCGAQLRYLIHSHRYGVIGGLAFSAAAWRVKARDTFIGWNDHTRAANLSQVVNNSRFLLRPEVRVKNLASFVLSLAIRRLPADWYHRYQVRPLLLETFVDTRFYRGTAYRAANWIDAGFTNGRGRQDRFAQHPVSVKRLFLYPLHRHYRTLLRYNERDVSTFPPSSPVEFADWVEEEFQGVSCGDLRLKKRLLTLVRDFYACPTGNIPQVCGSRAKTKACYRFFDHPAMNLKTILAPHFRSTQHRVAQEPLALVCQDTTTLNYQTHLETEGFGPIGTSSQKAIGLLLHASLAVTPNGVPLGLVDIQCYARDPASLGKKHRRSVLPLEEKESQRWLTSFDATARLQKECPQTTLVSIADREADLYDLFVRATTHPHAPKLLIRAFQKRALAGEEGTYLQKLATTPGAGCQPITVPRRKNRRARHAELVVRFCEVTLQPPRQRPQEPPVTLWAVSAEEETPPPDGSDPISWVLLTTMPVHHFQDACERIQWYCHRWLIEIYHRTLKSGCKIEERQLRTADRIENCLAIDLVVAWRIFFLAKQGRETPDVPCTVFFEEAEWKALVAYVTHNPLPPARPPTLQEAIRMVASLGGFLGRKGDGHPGTKSMWLGLQRLDDITSTYKVLFPYCQFDPSCKPPSVSRQGRYG
jgi:hypothetical protein